MPTPIERGDGSDSDEASLSFIGIGGSLKRSALLFPTEPPRGKSFLSKKATFRDPITHEAPRKSLKPMHFLISL